jgi:hypothetical protein
MNGNADIAAAYRRTDSALTAANQTLPCLRTKDALGARRVMPPSLLFLFSWGSPNQARSAEESLRQERANAHAGYQSPQPISRPSKIWLSLCKPCRIRTRQFDTGKPSSTRETLGVEARGSFSRSCQPVRNRHRKADASAWLGRVLDVETSPNEEREGCVRPTTSSEHFLICPRRNLLGEPRIADEV